MAGITGPCPECGQPVASPESFAISSPKTQLRRPFLVAALAASLVGLGWSVKQQMVPGSKHLCLVNPPVSAPAVPKTEQELKEEAIARSKETVQAFLAAKDWPSARRLVDPRDITGSLSEAAFRPEQFAQVVKEAQWTPETIEGQGDAGTYQIRWIIQSPTIPARLILTAADTPNGPRVRWFRPPVFEPLTVGTIQPAAAPAAVAQTPPVPPAITTPTPEAPTPKPKPTTKETVAAATEAAKPTITGSAPLLTPASAQKSPEKSTAANRPATPKQTPPQPETR